MGQGSWDLSRSCLRQWIPRWSATADQAVFRARTDLVAISASVKRGNAPVANLAAADFRVTDNGVAQSIDAVTIESVPLDVTLFMDTSGSTAGALDRMKKNVVSIAGMLRPDDQFRLLTIGLVGGNAGAVAARRQQDDARHEGRPRHLAGLRRAVRRTHPHAGGRTPPPDRRDDRRPGLRQPPRRRARARRQRAAPKRCCTGSMSAAAATSIPTASAPGARRPMPAKWTTSARVRPAPAATRTAPASATPPSAPSRRSLTNSGKLRAPLHAARRAGERLACGHRARPRSTGADDQGPVRLLRGVRADIPSTRIAERAHDMGLHSQPA